MIIIDYSQLSINSITANLKDSDLTQDNIGLVRHVVLSSIANIKSKFKKDFGTEIVFAIDNKEVPYWRKEINPFYKGNRKKNRDKSKIDWKFVHRAMGTLREEIEENFPYKVISVERAEADDVIAVLTKHITQTRKQKSGLIEESEKILIVSGDSDFNQLHIYSNVEQYSPREKQLVTIKSKKKIFASLVEKIVRGESGDGITNILSPIDSLVVGKRQKAVSTEKLLNPIIESTDISFLTEEQQNQFRMNRTLIDFNYIPTDISDNIISKYTECEVKGNATKVMNYLMKNDLKVLFSKIDEF